MNESRQIRRAKLAEQVKRYRRLLSAMRLAEERGASSMNESIAGRIQAISDELRKMEEELHELNVQQIRDELSGG
jgi:hypothetical protein